MGVEVIRPDVSAEHHVIIEVNELLREAWDAVDVGLDGRGAESGEVAAILEDVLEVTRKIKNQFQSIVVHYVMSGASGALDT